MRFYAYTLRVILYYPKKYYHSRFMLHTHMPCEILFFFSSANITHIMILCNILYYVQNIISELETIYKSPIKNRYNIYACISIVEE